MMLSTIAKKNSIKNVLKWIFSGFSIFFIAMLVFMLVHDSNKRIFPNSRILCKVWLFSIAWLRVKIKMGVRGYNNTREPKNRVVAKNSKNR
jgi:hypothetical protein